MIIKLGNGIAKLRAVKIASGKWAVVFGQPDGKGETADGWDAKRIYTPVETDLVIELTNLDSGGILQRVLNSAMQSAFTEQYEVQRNRFQ